MIVSGPRRLCSRFGGTRRNGLIFRAGDVDALTAALREALSDRERLIRWGETGNGIVARYNYAHATAGLEAAFLAVTGAQTNG